MELQLDLEWREANKNAPKDSTSEYEKNNTNEYEESSSIK